MKIIAEILFLSLFLLCRNRRKEKFCKRSSLEAKENLEPYKYTYNENVTSYNLVYYRRTDGWLRLIILYLISKRSSVKIQSTANLFKILQKSRPFPAPFHERKGHRKMAFFYARKCWFNIYYAARSSDLRGQITIYYCATLIYPHPSRCLVTIS
ncbi:hypothetical protein UNH65_29935 [Chitinophaga sp. 180180018-2]|nr:hypothetical protein [Chitinophaga sp. 212800010-3]